MNKYRDGVFSLQHGQITCPPFFVFLAFLVLLFFAIQQPAFAESIVQFSNPVDGATVNSVVPVSVTASNSAGVAKISLYIGGVLKGTSSGSALSYSWDTTSLAPGWVTLKAIARDALGNDSVTTILVQATAPVASAAAAAPLVPPSYEGWFDSVDCSAGFTGWGWDKNLPTTALNVDVYADGVKVVSGAAGAFRTDLINAGKGDGKHGFVIPIPAAMQNGIAHTYSINFSGTSVALKLVGGVKVATCGSALPPAAPSPTANYEGWFDNVDCSVGLVGWAWDKNQPATAIAVDLYADNVKFGWAVASTLRADLLNAGKGSGFHSFTVPIPAALQDGIKHVYSIRYNGTPIALGLSGGNSKTATCGNVTPAPTPAPAPGATPVFEGWLESTDCVTGVYGWAWDKNQPATPIAVDVYADNVKLGSVTAGTFRQDLQNAGKGDGRHGFSLPLPPTLLDGLAHTFSVKYSGTTVALNIVGTKAATCGVIQPPAPSPSPVPLPSPTPPPIPPASAQFEGWFDRFDCVAGLVGWAWDKNRPSTPVTVDVLIDGVLFTSVLANGFRQDLVDAGKGDGRHGYIIPIPDNLKNAVLHNYAISVGGAGVALNGSPKAVSCGIPTPPPVPSGKFDIRLIPQPGVGPASPMKHLRLVVNQDTGIVFVSSGDWAGTGPWYQSYRQESYFYDVMNDQWSPAHGYLSTSANDVVPAHPDQMGLAWDSKRKIFWQFPGYQSAPAAETGTSGVLTFNPVAKQWSVPAPMDPMPHMQYEPVKFAQYDAQNDQLIQLGDDKSAHFSPVTGTWDVQYYGNNGNGNRLIKGNYTALVGREIWSIDSRYNNLVKYNMDTRVITDVEPLPFVPGEEHVNLVFDPVRRALVFLGDYHWTDSLNPDGSQVLPPFYVYWVDKPLGSRWEQRQFVQMPDQIRSIADSMVYHPQSGKIMMIGDTWDGNKYFYLYSIN